MTTIAIKQKLIQQIQETKNKTVLQEVYRLLEIDDTEMEILVLNDPQQKKIRQAKEDIQQERMLSDEQANKEIDKWLSE